MANEVTYAQIEGKYSTDYRVLADSMLDALYENARLIIGFLKRKSLAGFHSTTERFPKKPKLAASSIADGVDMSNTPYAPTQVSLTVGEVGLLLTLTDLNRLSSLQDAAEYGREAGEAIAEKLLTDITALFAGFSSSEGSTGAALTEAQFLAARSTLLINRHKGPYVSVLYPNQIDDLMADIGTTLATIVGTGGRSPRAETNDMTLSPSMDMGEWYNVTIISSTTVPTANAGADSAGGMFAGNRALAMVEKWGLRSEMERDISLRADELASTAAYAVGEVDDTAGVAIVTDR